jgi:hypothetical protein
MEAVFFVLIGVALFSHSWHLLGLYPDGRTMGLFTGGLGLASLIAISFAPMVLVGGDPDANVLAETNIIKLLIVAWAGYAIGVGAQGLWEFDDRAIGFYSAILTAISAVAFIYFAVNMANAYGNDVLIALSAATLLLSVMAGIMFFYLAIPFNGLRLVAGWFLLVGSAVVAGIGLLIVTALIEVK